MTTRTGLTICVCLIGCLTTAARSELVVFENTNPAFERIPYYQSGPGFSVLGHSLCVTRSAFDQPEPGVLPERSVLILWARSPVRELGDWISMGPGYQTRASVSETPGQAVDPFTGAVIDHQVLRDHDDGSVIGPDATWSGDWSMLHANISTAPTDKGLAFTDMSFTIGLEFIMDGRTHYGFAQIERNAFDPSDPLSIDYRPVRWGYQTTAGTPVPSPGAIGLLSLCGLLSSRRVR